MCLRLREFDTFKIRSLPEILKHHPGHADLRALCLSPFARNLDRELTECWTDLHCVLGDDDPYAGDIWTPALSGIEGPQLHL